MSHGRWMHHRQSLAMAPTLRRPCVGFCLSSLCGCAYRYHMHFYCFHLDFAYTLSKESRKLMVDKGTDLVLHRSAKFGKHPAFLRAVKYRYWDLSRFVLIVVAIVRHTANSSCVWHKSSWSNTSNSASLKTFSLRHAGLRCQNHRSWSVETIHDTFFH